MLSQISSSSQFKLMSADSSEILHILSKLLMEWDTCVTKIWIIKKKWWEMQSTFFSLFFNYTVYVDELYYWLRHFISQLKNRITLFIWHGFLFLNDDHSKYFHKKNIHTMRCVYLNNKCYCLQTLNITH